MAPLKFEDKMKEKLEQRTMQPSKESWKKLEKLLDQEEDKKNRSYWWLGIAAGFVGILIIVSIFVKSDNIEKTPSDNYVITTEKTENDDEHKTEIVQSKQELKGETKQEADKTTLSPLKNESIDIAVPESSIVIKESDSSDDHQSNTRKDENQVAVSSSVNKVETSKKVPDVISIDSVGIQEKLIAIAAQVQELEHNNREVTDEEIDNLLKQAQKEITTEQILRSNKVSASALLSDVESELDETFKEKVYEALKTGFRKLKTSVVERNN